MRRLLVFLMIVSANVGCSQVQGTPAPKRSLWVWAYYGNGPRGLALKEFLSECAKEMPGLAVTSGEPSKLQVTEAWETWRATLSDAGAPILIAGIEEGDPRLSVTGCDLAFDADFHGKKMKLREVIKLYLKTLSESSSPTRVDPWAFDLKTETTRAKKS